MRRMERVEQNLLRLSDIVDEVESRLRSMRAQAGKARRYRGMHRAAAATSHRSGARRLAALHASRSTPAKRRLADLKRRVDERPPRCWNATKPKLKSWNAASRPTPYETREIEVQASATREQIAALQATIDSQRDTASRTATRNRPNSRATGGLGFARRLGWRRLPRCCTQLQTAEAELSGNRDRLPPAGRTCRTGQAGHRSSSRPATSNCGRSSTNVSAPRHSPTSKSPHSSRNCSMLRPIRIAAASDWQNSRRSENRKRPSSNAIKKSKPT